MSQIKSTTDTGVNELKYNFIYDNCGRLQSISVGGQPLVTTEYDDNHRPKTKTYGNGQFVETFYDCYGTLDG